MKKKKVGEVGGGKLTREKGTCPGFMEGTVGGTQGKFYSPFLEGDQLGSPEKGDIRDFTLNEDNS